MSALPPTADIRRTGCHVRFVPLATNAPQQTAFLFDHLVGAGEQRLRQGEAERLGGLEVDHQLELCRLFNRQITRLCTF
jgi:hypothetical protein